MMIEGIEILAFLKQVGFALAGAGSLLGLYFYYKQRNTIGEEKKVMEQVSQKMLKPIGIGLLAVLVAWALFDFTTSYSVAGHKGITIDPDKEGFISGLEFKEPLLLAILILFMASVFYKVYTPSSFVNNSYLFYLPMLVFSTIAISFPIWTGEFDYEKWFFIGHNFHSILTLGTVVILDFLMLITKHTKGYDYYIYPLLPTISKVIWLGLFLDFASVYLVYYEAIEFTAKFAFMQTVVGIIVINGALLSGPITNKMIETVKKGRHKLPWKWEVIATISGTVSIASWTTITFTDFLKGIDGVSYLTLMAFYIGFIALGFVVYSQLEHYKVGSKL